jgi:hypothetical protein
MSNDEEDDNGENEETDEGPEDFKNKNFDRAECD